MDISALENWLWDATCSIEGLILINVASLVKQERKDIILEFRSVYWALF